MAKTEMTVARNLVHAALSKGFVVSVNDGGAWPVKKSAKFREIVNALGSSDTDTLVIRRHDGSLVGCVMLIWGNDPDEVIADHTDNAETTALVEQSES